MHPQKWEGMPAVYLACGILADISHVSKKMRSGFQWHSDVSKTWASENLRLQLLGKDSTCGLGCLEFWPIFQYT